LAAANPVKSKYDPSMSVVDNIKMPPTLLSRFDLIYLVLDKQSEAADRRLANHIVSLYSNISTENDVDEKRPAQTTELLRSNTITREFFAEYISYARKCVTPKLTDSI
jgi:DNA replication licensing factor MCM4